MHLQRLGILSPCLSADATSLPPSSSSSSVSSGSECQHPPLDATAPIYVPPLNFAIVSPGVYRSGFPRPENYLYLDQLGLRSILYLADQDFKEDTQKWAKKRGLRIMHYRVESNKEPLQEASRAEMEKALEQVLDGRNHPIIIACNRGKHRVGLLAAIIRRLQGWSLTMTFDEYKRFFASTNAAGEGKDAGGRVSDYEWIETFDLAEAHQLARSEDAQWLKRPT